MTNIQLPSLTYHPLPALEEPKTPPPAPTNKRQTIRTVVEPDNLLSATTTFFELAERYNIKEVSVMASQPVFSCDVDPPRMMMRLSLRFSPDLDRSIYSSDLLNKISLVKRHYANRK